MSVHRIIYGSYPPMTKTWSRDCSVHVGDMGHREQRGRDNGLHVFSPICSGMTRFSSASLFCCVNSLNSSKASRFSLGSLPVVEGEVRRGGAHTCL